MTSAKKIKAISSSLILGLLLSAMPTCAHQQEPPPPDPKEGQQPKPAGANSPISPGDDTSGDEPQAPPLTPGTPINTDIRVLGTATPYTGFDTPLRWGPFSIAGVNLLGVQDWFNPGLGAPTSELALGLLQVNLDFDVVLHRSHLVLQYTPQAVIQGGQITANGSTNNNFGLGMNFDITPRFAILVKEQFTFNQTRQVFSDQVLQIYQGAGGILPGDFLQNNGSYLNNTFSVAFSYKLSPRWTLTTEPLVRYIDLTNDSLNYHATGIDSRDTVALTYALSAKSNLSFGYNFEEGHTFEPTVTDSYYNGLAVFYSRQISPSFWIQGNAGAETVSYSNQATPPVFFTGSFSFVKNVSKSAFAFAATREKDLANYYTDLLSDRYDASFTLPISRRMTWKSGAGYYYEIGTQPHTQGKYAQTTLDFHLTPSVSLFGNYTFRFQHAETLQLITGTHNTVIYGIRWEPNPLARK
jgi:hypothetical protein